ncbi:MAG: XdhC family protein [Cyanobacteria bacterium J06633_2]
MSIDFYRVLQRRLLSNPVVAIATVVQVNGSVPREASAKMLIQQDGQAWGTIGGGAGEAKVTQYAQDLFRVWADRDRRQRNNRRNSPSLLFKSDSLDDASALTPDSCSKGWVTIDLTGPHHQSSEGVCGGTMRVWVELWAADWGIELSNCIIQALEARQAIALVTPLTPNNHPYVEASARSTEPFERTNSSFIETLLPPPVLLIIGAGHVGVALAQVAAIVGFDVFVHDDRHEMLRAERFQADVTFVSGAITPVLQPNSQSSERYIALVTRGVAYDLEAIATLSQIYGQTAIRYIGMIGSKRRVSHVFKQAEKNGIDREFLQHIHAPIGLEIGALTPEEIAVSICAELIQKRRS